MTSAGEQLLAHHLALLAIPAFIPALVVVGVVLYIARRDRIDEAREAREQREADRTSQEDE